jgi:hypothetical protein
MEFSFLGLRREIISAQSRADRTERRGAEIAEKKGKKEMGASWQGETSKNFI